GAGLQEIGRGPAAPSVATHVATGVDCSNRERTRRPTLGTLTRNGRTPMDPRGHQTRRLNIVVSAVRSRPSAPPVPPEFERFMGHSAFQAGGYARGLLLGPTRGRGVGGDCV